MFILQLVNFTRRNCSSEITDVSLIESSLFCFFNKGSTLYNDKLTLLHNTVQRCKSVVDSIGMVDFLACRAGRPDLSGLRHFNAFILCL